MIGELQAVATRASGCWFPSILKSLVPHDPQVPRNALRPFLSVTSWGELISLFAFSFMQYASVMGVSTNTGDKRPWSKIIVLLPPKSLTRVKPPLSRVLGRGPEKYEVFA